MINELFPTRSIQKWPIRTEVVTPTISEMEAQQAAGRMKNKKAAGPDGIPSEIAKMTVEVCPKYVTEMMNECLVKGEFPKEWKRANLVLIPKPPKLNTEKKSYRPICLLDSMAKMLEHILKNRIEEALLRTGGFSNSQYGFRSGRSTIDAMERVTSAAMKEKNKTLKTRQLCAAIMIDVKNAFNSVPWDRVMAAMEKRKIPEYLLQITESYFTDRRIVSEGMERKVYAGVPQGSVLGPTLWNIVYDELLRENMPEGVELVAYADDLAIIVKAAKELDLTRRGNEAIRRTTKWMERNGLQIAHQKTEAVMLSGRKKHEEICFTCGEI